MLTMQNQGTTGTEDKVDVLPIAQRLMRLDPLEGINNREKEERARMYYSFDMKWSLQFMPRMNELSEDINKDEPGWELDKNISKAYSAAVLVRRNYELWEQYLLDPRKGVPAAFQSFAEDTKLVYYLAALSKHGIINLDPSKAFLDVERVNGEYLIERKRPEGFTEQMLSLWDSLGRPRVNCYDWFERAHDAVFSPLQEGASQYWIYETDSLVGGGGTFWGGKYYGLHPNDDTIDILTHEKKSPGEVICRLDTTSLTSDISLAMVFDSPNIDTLELIRELFPTSPDMITRSIRMYRFLSVFSPFTKAMKDDSLSQELHRDMFGADVPYGEGLSHRSPLRHSGALKQIRERPELFEFWAEDPMMNYIYHDLVEPALWEKRCQQSIDNHSETTSSREVHLAEN